MEIKSFIYNFEEYNKDILSLRTEFFKDCNIIDLKNLINDLQYETNNLKSNFRWGQRYFNNQQEKFSWISSINGKIKFSYFNRVNREVVSFDKKVFLDNKTIEEHSLSHKKSKRKLGFYYKLDNKDKKRLEDYSNLLTNLYMMNKKTYGLSQKENTDVLWFDLDNHNKINFITNKNEAIEKLLKIMNLFNITLKDFLYLEANLFTGGIHCALKLPFIIKKDSSFFQNLEKYLNTKVNVECNFQTKLLRLPLSYEYLPLKRDLDLEKITSFSKEHFIDTFREAIQNMNYNPIESEFFNNYDDNFNLIKKVIKKETSQEKFLRIRNQLTESIKIKNEKYWSTPQNLFIRNKVSNIKTKELYKINKGNRWETFKKLIPYLKISGKTLEQVFEILKIQNVNSKDMKDFDKLKKDITNFYNNIKIKKREVGIYQNYISNQGFLSEITLNFFNDEDFQKYLTDRFVQNYVKVRYYKNNFVSEEKYQILLKQIPYFIKEIIGKMYYDINNPKEFKNQKLNRYIGFQLSYTHLEKIQEQSIIDLKLEESPLNKTSLQYLKKALLLTLDLEEIENNCKGKRNWIKGSCKSFRINSYNDIEEVLKHFYNSCFRELVNKNFIKQKKIYTFYISLIENNEIINLDDVLFIKSHIPIINDS